LGKGIGAFGLSLREFTTGAAKHVDSVGLLAHLRIAGAMCCGCWVWTREWHTEGAWFGVKRFLTAGEAGLTVENVERTALYGAQRHVLILGAVSSDGYLRSDLCVQHAHTVWHSAPGMIFLRSSMDF
jgi:hypothetical protein